MNPLQTFISATLIMSSMFMGFQMDRWWEEKREHRIQISYLDRLIVDLKTDEKKLRSREEYFSNVKRFGSTAIEFLNTPSTDKVQQRETLTAFYLASHAWDFTPSSTTFDELRSSGALSLIRDVELRKTLAVYYQTLKESNYVWQAPNYYRRTIRSIIPPSTQRALWQQCHELADQGSRQAFVNNCSPNIAPAEVALILEQIQRSTNVRSDLYFMMSNVDIGLDLFRDHIARTKKIVLVASESREKELPTAQ